jgi:hypothetical protein
LGDARRSLGSLVPTLDHLLPVWFVGWSLLRLWQLGLGQLGLEFSWFGNDFRIYRNAALEILASGDPWTASAPWNGVDWHYAAPPTAAQLFIPFALIPEEVALLLFTVAGAILTLAALRRLGLAAWWILFPPCLEGFYAGNPQIIVFPLLALGSSAASGIVGRAIAVGFKIYAIVPIVAERRWLAVIASAGLVVLSVAIAPQLWVEYLTRFGEISERLSSEAVGGVSAALLLDPAVTTPAVAPDLAPFVSIILFTLPLALIILVSVRDVRAAGWIAVPLLWPVAQYSYGSFVLPVARRWSTWIIAVPTIPTYLVGLLLLCYEIAAGRPPVAVEPTPEGLATWISRFRTPRA